MEPETTTIRVAIPYHLRTLAKVTGELRVDVPAPASVARVLDEIEARYPMLQGTIRDHFTRVRRPFIRFLACEQDLSNEPADAPLPPQVLAGAEPLLIIGALAGG